MILSILFLMHRCSVPLLDTEDLLPDPSIEWPTEFHYLGRGRQCFAYESGEYVLKFFDRWQLEIPWYAYFWKNKRARLEAHIKNYPQSYRLAYQWLKKETGLLAVHQGKTSVSYPTVKVGRYKIDLNKVPFILQKKGKVSLPNVDQFLAMHRQRIALGIADDDRNLTHNYAFDSERLIYIDPGRFHRFDSDYSLLLAEWMKATRPLRRFIPKEKIPYFDAKVQEFLDWQKPRLYREGVCGKEGMSLSTALFIKEKKIHS